MTGNKNASLELKIAKRMLDKLPDLMQDPDFAVAWQETEAELSIAGKMLHARRAAGLSQVELAKRANTNQSFIARLESDLYKANPKIGTLSRIAKAMQTKLRIEFVPEEDSGAAT